MIARLGFTTLVAFAIVACASIDPPAAFVPAEAAPDPSITDAATCRPLPRAFSGNARANLYGAPGGPQAICVTIQIIDVPAAGPGLVTFCIAGNDLPKASLRIPRDIESDTRTCAYCIDARTNCKTVSDGGVDEVVGPCNTSYVPTKGTLRVMRLGDEANDEVWFDVGDLVFARVRERTDAGTYVLDPLSADCVSADGLTFQGKLVAATCTDDSIECQIANTASSRFP